MRQGAARLGWQDPIAPRHDAPFLRLPEHLEQVELDHSVHEEEAGAQDPPQGDVSRQGRGDGGPPGGAGGGDGYFLREKMIKKIKRTLPVVFWDHISRIFFSESFIGRKTLLKIDIFEWILL